MATVVGGIKQGVQMDDHKTKILTHIREVDEDVREHPLSKVDQQVVSGMMYYFHFDCNGQDRVVTVWSQPWLGNRIEITKHNGQKIERSCV
jgi:hypothetical protein